MLRLPASFTRESLIWELVSSLEPPGETHDPPPLTATPPRVLPTPVSSAFSRRVSSRPGSKRGSTANMIGLAMLRRRALAGLTPLVVFIAV